MKRRWSPIVQAKIFKYYHKYHQKFSRPFETITIQIFEELVHSVIILQISRPEKWQIWWGLLEAAYIIVAIKVETACSASVLVHTQSALSPLLSPLHPRPDIWNAHNLLFYWTKPLEGPRAAQAAQLQSNRHILPTAPRLGESGEWARYEAMECGK